MYYYDSQIHTRYEHNMYIEVTTSQTSLENYTDVTPTYTSLKIKNTKLNDNNSKTLKKRLKSTFEIIT